MSDKPTLIIADAEFLSELPDLAPNSAEVVAIAALSEAGRLKTIKEAKDFAEDAYQAVVNSSLYQKIDLVDSSKNRKALARTLAPSMPPQFFSRNNQYNDLLVAAAAIQHAGAILTTSRHASFYKKFDPALGVTIYRPKQLISLL